MPKAAGLSWPLPAGLSGEALEELLFPRREPSARHSLPQPDWATIHKELRRKSVTLSLLWVEYRQAHPAGYGYSQFCHHYRQWAKQLKLMMRPKHRAEEKLFIDYAGQTAPVIDPETGEVEQAQIFVAVLGASNYTYVEAHASQSLPQQPYEFARRKKSRVHIDYHVAFDKHYYSVPHALIGKEVEVRATEKTVEIFYRRQRQAAHRCVRSPGRYSTQRDHMSPAHQVVDDWLRDPLSRSQARDLLEILDDRHGLSATLVVTQNPVTEWHSRLPSPAPPPLSSSPPPACTIAQSPG